MKLPITVVALGAMLFSAPAEAEVIKLQCALKAAKADILEEDMPLLVHPQKAVRHSPVFFSVDVEKETDLEYPRSMADVTEDQITISTPFQLDDGFVAMIDRETGELEMMTRFSIGGEKGTIGWWYGECEQKKVTRKF